MHVLISIASSIQLAEGKRRLQVTACQRTEVIESMDKPLSDSNI